MMTTNWAGTSVTIDTVLATEAVEQELRCYGSTVKGLWERYVSMKASHPESAEVIETVYGTLRDELMADHSFAGGL